MAQPDFSMDEVMAQMRKHLPADEGMFCKSDLMVSLDINDKQARNLLTQWRRDGLIEPAGKVNRTNSWGDLMRVAAYRWVGQEDE